MSSICKLNFKGKKMEAVLVCQQQYFISVLEKQKRLLWNLFLRSHMDCLKILAKYVSKYTPKLLECEVILRKIEDICTFLDKIINFISIFSNININHMSLTQSICILIQSLHIKCIMYSWTQHNIFYEMQKELLSNKKYIWLWCSRAFPKAKKSLWQLNLRPEEGRDSCWSIRACMKSGILVRAFLQLKTYCILLKYLREGAANYLQLSLGDAKQVLDNLLQTVQRYCCIFAYSQLSPEQMIVLSCQPQCFYTKGF